MARSSESDDARLTSSIAVLQIVIYFPSYIARGLCESQSKELAYTGTSFRPLRLFCSTLSVSAQASIMARLAAVLSAAIAAVAAAEPKVTNKAEIQRLNSRDLPAVPTVRCARGIEAQQFSW